MAGTDATKIHTWLKRGLIVLGTLAAFALVFGAGFWAGRVTASPFGVFSASVRAPRGGHGATGTIQEIAGQKIIIKERDGKLQTILVNADTRFDKGFQKISQSDLKVNDQIIVLGSPDAEGQIIARLVGLLDANMRPRGFPAPPPIR